MSVDLLERTFEGHPVRLVVVDDEPRVVVADVCAVLGIVNPRQAAGRLDPDAVCLADVIDALGRTQQTTVVDEGGLYELVLRSDKPAARTFARWVTREVLPEIRRTGSFSLVPQTYAQALRAHADAVEAQEAAEQRALAAESTVEAQAPKVEAFDALMDADGLYPMEAAAKAIGIGRNTMMRRLRELGILQANNLPYQRHAHHFEVILGSYTDRHDRSHATRTARVKPPGVEFIRRKLVSPAGDTTVET